MSRNELSHYTTAPVLQQRNITDNTPAMHVPLHSMQIADPIFAFNQNINSNKVQSNYGLQNVPLNRIYLFIYIFRNRKKPSYISTIQCTQ